MKNKIQNKLNAARVILSQLDVDLERVAEDRQDLERKAQGIQQRGQTLDLERNGKAIAKREVMAQIETLEELLAMV